MNNYKYSLDRRRGRAYIHICPECGKREFKRYVDTESGSYIDDNVGRCNREIKCGYHYPPREYFRDDPSFISTKSYNRISKPKPTVPKNVTHHCVDISVVYARCEGQAWRNPFTRWLLRIALPRYGEALLIDAIKKYRLGSSQDDSGGVIFWQIDGNNQVSTGKIMRYNEQTGKRIKDDSGAKVDWIHSRLERAKRLPANFELKQCLFGEHLLFISPEAIVFVFEGEKSAVLASICFPHAVCIATGGLHGLSAEKCRVLEGRKVMFFPDLDATKKWREKVEEIARTVHFKSYGVSDLLEQEATEQDKREGLDLCDFLVREIENNNIEQ